MLKYTSISRLVMTPVLAALIILVLLNASSIHKSFSLLNHFDQLEKTLVTAERDVSKILSTFKTQVQEWKNVLLRGSDEAKRNKYWASFQAREAEIDSAFEALLLNPKISDTARADIERFMRAHQTMAAKYREGYNAFVASGFDAKVADSYVQGIDREPAQLLAAIGKNIAEQSQQAFEDMRTDTRQTLWTILFAAVALSILSTLYVVVRLRRQVINPTKEIASGLAKLASSQYSDRISYSSEHELGVLADSARAIQNKLQSSVNQLQHAEKDMKKAVSTLGEVSESIQQGAVEQHETSQTLDSSTDKLREIVQSLVSITDQVAVATNNSERNVASCYATFEKANEGFRQLANTVNQSSEIVNDLQSRSANILKVVNVINEIADQTNLLALNAAIEAARAGEHGRGFAVVADEVRALAAKTQQSTREINNILTSFEAEARGAVTAMQAGKALSESNAQEAGTALITLTTVVNDIKETSTVVVALNAAADEQEAVLSDVETVIQNVISSSKRYHQLSQRNDISHSMQSMAMNVEKVVHALTR
ncbi:chemotaxis protein [Alteromonas pelagimontana]|uniref:Chemotaxis protein n=1 Tax=Alteromonas pelagimontana TaxID=1858656 RepID=A0A6M4MG59_9ALTE|nr:methyl-accepting chemotaxis protein [Alteromonas pelagimontana]QJR82052.1 chemotaxis protein [Alteromonas pelagimontana]